MRYAHMLYRRAHDPRRTFVVRLHQSRSPPHPITERMAHSDYRVTQRCDRSETIWRDTGQSCEILAGVSQTSPILVQTLDHTRSCT